MGLETLRFCTGNDEKCCTLVYIMSPEKIQKKCTPLCMANKGRGGGGAVVCIGMFVDHNKLLNRTLAIDSPFQTFTVGLVV